MPAYSKEYQLRGHQKEKDKPDFKQRRPNRTKRHTKKHESLLKPPSRTSRAEFSMKDKQKIDEIYGHACVVCGNPYIEYHHCKFRSGLGRGTWRNGIPLCHVDHRLNNNSPHMNEKVAEQYRQEKLARYGPYYYMDAWDLFKRQLIPNTTEEAFEEFMQKEEVKAHGN